MSTDQRHQSIKIKFDGQVITPGTEDQRGRRSTAG